ncbi:LysR family transcriptional regulator [Herbaspirillum rubrisubalbicans]|uniref:LysR family transcriptional regulator n=1 Tax=Herbaspirillum rubrisubalbicans TaxID=80842 RepID=UPI0002E4D1B0
MRLPDLNLLVALDVLLEEGSAASAARRLNISAPAMSRTLSRIREVFGDPILVRSGRGLAPTPRALELHEQVRAVVEQAYAVFAAGRQIDLLQLERTFNLRANDVFVGAYGGKLRAIWLKQNKLPLGKVCRAIASVEPDATRRQSLADMMAGAERAFGVPQIVVASEEAALASLRQALAR